MNAAAKTVLVALLAVLYVLQAAEAGKKNCRRIYHHCQTCDKSSNCLKCKPGYTLINGNSKKWNCVKGLSSMSSSVNGSSGSTTPGSTTPAPGAGSCQIFAQSFSVTSGALGCTPLTPWDQYGFIRLNGDQVYTINFCTDGLNGFNNRGFHVMTVDPATCSELGTAVFDTGKRPSDAQALADLLTNAPKGTVFAGITGDEPQSSVSSAVSALNSACGVDISILQKGGSVAFICQIGIPSTTTNQVVSAALKPGAAIYATLTADQVAAAPKPPAAGSTPPANCQILAQGYGTTGGAAACLNPDTYFDQYGYVKLNGVPVFTEFFCLDASKGLNNRGFHVINVNPFACTAVRTGYYNTGDSTTDSEALANLLLNTPNGTLFAIITGDNPWTSLTPAADALKSACGVDVSTLMPSGSIAIVCQIGSPAKTLSQIMTPASPGAVVLTTVTGTTPENLVFSV